MRDLIDDLISLGLGIAVASKEQIEKIAEELIEKGEMSKNESKEFVDTILRKGEDAKKEFDDTVKSRIQQTLKELDLVTMEEYRKLEERVAELEKKLP